jgi:hypothetical protein
MEGDDMKIDKYALAVGLWDWVCLLSGLAAVVSLVAALVFGSAWWPRLGWSVLICFLGNRMSGAYKAQAYKTGHWKR